MSIRYIKVDFIVEYMFVFVFFILQFAKYITVLDLKYFNAYFEYSAQILPQ